MESRPRTAQLARCTLKLLDPKGYAQCSIPSVAVTRASGSALRITRRCSLDGVISPCLLNVALHGLEEAAGVGYRARGTRPGGTQRGSPVAVRYADDVVVLCHSQQQAEHVKARLAEWLAPRGLAFNEDKTRIVSLNEGFDFLGATRGRTVRVSTLIGGLGVMTAA